MSEQSGTPARYARTTQGLLASLLVTVPLVLVVFLFLRLDNGAAEKGPARVDFQEAVDAASGAGIEVVHPVGLPRTWKATSVSFDPQGRTAWGIGFLTPSGRFAGVRQEDDDLDDLLTTYVDAEPVKGDTVTVDSPIAPTWQSWSDSGGDHAFSTEIDANGEKDTVLVYGSASVADLTSLLESLVAG